MTDQDQLTPQETREPDDAAGQEAADPTFVMRRAARYEYARRRIQKIADGMPPLTEAQRDQLALILSPGRPS
jgi:hypothetical protein